MKWKNLALFLSTGVAAAFMVGQKVEARACITGDHAEVLVKGDWLPALVIKTTSGGNRCRVHFDNNARPDTWVNPKNIRVVTAPKSDLNKKYALYNPGASVRVYTEKKWRPATVISSKKNQYYVHYDNKSDDLNEWVDASQVRER